MRRSLTSTLRVYQAFPRRFFASRACVWAVALSVACAMLSPGLSAAAEFSAPQTSGAGDVDGDLVAAALAPAGALSGTVASSRAPLARGVYVPGGAQNAALLSAFEVQMGAPAGIVHWYQPWGASQDPWYQPALDVEALRRVTAHGALPLITWEATGAVASAGGLNPSRLRTIVGGHFDTYIDEWARGLKAFGKPVYLRPFHEMNNSAYAWAYGQTGNTAADEVAAWRYVHDRFARIGATNVLWVWSPNTENTQVAFSELYPGDEYVDWLGVDGYNGGTQLSWGGWLSPQQVFARSYASLTALSPAKPIMIAETSSVEQGGSKADWIQALFRDLPAAFPSVRAIVWFQADTTARGEADWRVGTSQSALEAFRQSA